MVAGGATRSASVRAGLAAVPDDAESSWSTTRPGRCPCPAVWDRVLAAVAAGADAAVPAVPVDRHAARGRRRPRSTARGFVAVQTPQAFRAAALRAAHAGEPEATDDASLVEAAGGRVVVVDGDPREPQDHHARSTSSLAELLCR